LPESRIHFLALPAHDFRSPNPAGNSVSPSQAGLLFFASPACWPARDAIIMLLPEKAHPKKVVLSKLLGSGKRSELSECTAYAHAQA
jgi:hypothetical protein